jgi:glucose/mannose-6-phosphate isomerase
VTTRDASPLSVDSAGMWEATASLPEQVIGAISRAKEADLGALFETGPFSEVVVCGMGGSGIAGDVLDALAWTRLGVPVRVVKGYLPPAHVGPRSLVFAVSCSGDTEETLSAAHAAADRGAAVVSVSGPGALAAEAARDGLPLVPVPAEFPQPRTAFGALCVPPLVVLERLGLLEGAEALLRDAADELARSRDQLVVGGGAAEQLAQRIGATIPLLHGAPGPTGVAAMRWKTQVNENAKAPALFSLQPELCHNEVAGWHQLADVTRTALTAVQLRYPGEHPQVARRMEAVKQLMTPSVANVIEVRTDAAEDVTALFDLVLLGDFVSLHLSAAAGIDPGPVPVLDDLKRRVASSWTG